MRTIFKYGITNGGIVDIPQDAKILTLGQQDRCVYAWFLVEPEAPRVGRRFRIYGTGWPMPDNPGTYIGTVDIGPFVWHVFEVT